MNDLYDVISSELCLDKDYIKKVVSRSEEYYRKYEIPKKNNKKRTIYQPSAELKTLQYWCINRIFSKFPISDAAFAYIKGKSIKNHAEQHRKCRFIAHFDIKDFFESIKSDLLVSTLLNSGVIFENESYDIKQNVGIISKICMFKNKLTIGSVCSPIISNIVMYQFDLNMIKYAKEHELNYSRYADDIYLSSVKYISKDVEKKLVNELRILNMRPNHSKTRYMSKANKRQVTGLVITPDKKITIGTKMRNEIKKMLYEKLVKGNQNIDSERLRGYLAYLREIEPHTYSKLFIKYKNYGYFIKTLNRSNEK